jgi:quercetin dioxygenase-like cupin family protein
VKITTLANAARVPFDLEGYMMHSSAGIEVIHLCLQPGQVVARHLNPFDVVVCLVKGEVILSAGEDHFAMATYDVAEVAALTERGFTNTSPSEARLIIIKKL